MHYLNITILLLAATFASAATKPATYNPATSALVQPDAATFAAKNNLVTNEVICVRVDMERPANTTYLIAHGKALFWSDCELKVLDKNGNLLYFATTSYNDVRNYHSTDGTWDANCKIYYYVSGTKYAAAGQCSSPKQLHTVSSSQTKSIATKEGLVAYGGPTYGYYFNGAQVSTVEFYPNLSGTINGKSVREIFLNPENSVIVSRKNNYELERGFTSLNNDRTTGERIWRPAIPQYYRTLP